MWVGHGIEVKIRGTAIVNALRRLHQVLDDSLGVGHHTPYPGALLTVEGTHLRSVTYRLDSGFGTLTPGDAGDVEREFLLQFKGGGRVQIAGLRLHREQRDVACVTLDVSTGQSAISNYIEDGPVELSFRIDWNTFQPQMP